MNNLKVKMKEKMNNKGFSLVELIIVIAIMAVLIAVLAPQFLRYVERSRYQKDRSAVAEVENSTEIALANETIAQAVTTNAGAVVTITPAGAVSCDVAAVTTELTAITGLTLNFTSNAFTESTNDITITVDLTPTGFTYVTAGLPTAP